MPSIHLTDKSLKTIPIPEKGTTRYYAKTPAGFGVWITSKGIITFFLRYRANGCKDRIYKIGRYPEWSVMAAQREAEKLKVEVDQGLDPQDRKNSERNAPTYAELWEEYKREILSNKSERAKDDELSMAKHYILPCLGNTRIKDIDSFDIGRLHRNITALNKPYRANRVIEVVRSSLNLAMRLNWINSNPAVGFKRNPETPRERYLNEEEMKQLQMALNADEDQRLANIIRLLLLTGARFGEIRKAEWDHFDLRNGTWTKPSSHTKQRKLHHIPLSKAALEVLLQMRSSTNSRFLFPQKENPEIPVTDIKRLWARIMKRSGIKNFRVHDLRHSYASILACKGLSLPVIAKLLGHSQVSTTNRYAHLSHSPLREATNLAATEMGFQKLSNEGVEL